jgi:hypothetical protein
MTTPGASWKRWLPALVLPLLAMVTVAVLSNLAKLGEATGGLDRQRVASPSMQSGPSSPAAPSAGLPRVPAAPAPIARSVVAEAREPKPELRKGFSPVLDRVEPAREPSGDAVIPNPPRTELPTAREIEVVPSAAPTSLE